MQTDLKISPIKKYIFSGGQVSGFTLTASVFSSWMWTTSIIGSAEAYQLYGIFGSLAYVGSAVIAFAAFIPILAAIRAVMPEDGTYLQLTAMKYNHRTVNLYYLFGFCVSAYVLIEQAVGIGILMESIFGISFKIISFLSVMACVVFIVLFGMKGLLKQEKAAFVIIILCFILMVIYFTGGGGSSLLNMEHRTKSYDGVILISSFRYFMAAMIIAFSQVFLDPAYYLKACLAKNTGQLYRTFSLSGIFLWGGISFVSSVFLGRFVQKGSENLAAVFPGIGVFICVAAITVIGISTISHFLMGMFGMFTIDYYRGRLKPEAEEKECVLFGRVMTVAAGIFCALTAISLEGISLLKIDMFCAVFFAAPCGPLMLAVKVKPVAGNLPMVAVGMGIFAGFFIWIGGFVPEEWSWMAGTLVSFFVPLFVMAAGLKVFEKIELWTR